MVWAIVPAAGRGQRLPGDVPKQYRRIGAMTVLDHTLTRLLAEPKIRGVMLVLSAADDWWPQSRFYHDERVSSCVGGAERADSVLAGLKALQALVDGPSGADAVIVHDAARALLPAEALQRLLADPPGADGALLAIPAQDTLKWSEDRGQVAKTLDRSHVWLAQTPQYFEFARLQQALDAALSAGVVITDEASCMEWRGYHPRLVEGDALNFKITTPADLRIAEVLQEKS